MSKRPSFNNSLTTNENILMCDVCKPRHESALGVCVFSIRTRKGKRRYLSQVCKVMHGWMHDGSVPYNQFQKPVSISFEIFIWVKLIFPRPCNQFAMTGKNVDEVKGFQVNSICFQLAFSCYLFLWVIIQCSEHGMHIAYVSFVVLVSVSCLVLQTFTL